MAKPFGLTPEVATCVAQLCCMDGALPQGAPTSPVISNLICRSLDHKLFALAKRFRCKVSRYADDICFSTSLREVPATIAVRFGNEYFAGPLLISAVDSSGFSLNSSKFKVRSKENQQLITGLIVNDGVSLPRKWRRQLRVVLHLTGRHGIDKAKEITDTWTRPSVSRRGAKSLEQVIRGKTYFSRYVDFRCSRKFSESIYRNYSGLRKFMPRPMNGVSFRVMSEGKTDLLHLEMALKWFQGNGEFTDFRPRFVNFPGEVGDIELMKTLERIAKSDIPELTIGVFDCDNNKFMLKHSLYPGIHHPLGSRVYTVCLGAPQNLVKSEFCIELLYPRNQLIAMTASGRRVFLPDEFDPASGLTSDGHYKQKYPKSSAPVVSDHVERLSDGFSALLSKSDFADMVYKKEPPFDAMNFQGFRPTFEALRRVIDEVYQ